MVQALLRLFVLISVITQASTAFAALQPPDGQPFSNNFGGFYAKTLINGSNGDKNLVNMDHINTDTSPSIQFFNTYGTSGTLTIHASRAGSAASFTVTDYNSGATYVTFPGDTAADFRSRIGLFRIVALKANANVNIRLNDSTYASTEYYPITVDFVPDEPASLSGRDWLEAGLNHEYKRAYIMALLQAISDVNDVGEDVKQMKFALGVADTLLTMGTSALIPDPDDASKLILDTNLASSLPKVGSEVDGIIKGVSCAADDAVIEAGSQLYDHAMALVNFAGGNPLGVYQTLMNDAALISIYSMGLYKADDVEELVNANMLVNKILLRQLNRGDSSKYMDYHVRNLAEEFAEYTEDQCDWFSDKLGCGLDNYDPDTVSKLYVRAWDRIQDWITRKKTQSNPYWDVDGDGLSNATEISTGSDPNNPVSPPPPSGQLALTAPSSSFTIAQGEPVTIRWSGANLPADAVKVTVQGPDGGRTIDNSAPASGSMTYTIPDSANLGSYKIVVSALGDSSISAQSPSFTVTSSVGSCSGEYCPVVSGAAQGLIPGHDYTVSWAINYSHLHEFRIYLEGNGYRRCFTPIGIGESAGSKTFSLAPDTYPVADGYTIALYQDINGTSGDLLGRSAPFAIGPSPTVSLVYPLNNEIWDAGTRHTVTWNCNGDNGNEASIRISPDNGDRYYILDDGPNTGSFTWTVSYTAPDGPSSLKVNTLAGVDSVREIIINNKRTITATRSEGGWISNEGTSTHGYGASATFTMTPDEFCRVKDVLLNGVSKGAVTTLTIDSIESNYTIHAEFEDTRRTIVPSYIGGGSISPREPRTYILGSDSAVYTFTPLDGWRVKDVLVNGVSQGAITSYTFNNIQEDGTIQAIFEVIPVPVEFSSDTDRTIMGGIPYQTPYPAVTNGTSPISWSLIAPPAGMVVDSETGVVHWPYPEHVDGGHLITLRATNGAGTTDRSWRLNVIYNIPGNARPVPDAGDDPVVSSGDTATLDGSGSSDAEGGIATWHWEQTGGPAVTINGADTATPTLTIPDSVTDAVLTFTLTVTDADGQEESTSVQVVVSSDPSFLLAQGRKRLLSATASGVREAKAMLDKAMAAGGASFPERDEVRLYLALADLGMRLIGEGTAQIDTLADVLAQYGLHIEGDGPETLRLARVDRLPAQTPDDTLLRQWIRNDLVPELASAKALFAELAAADFVATIPAGDGPFVRDTELDKGDLLLLETAVDATTAACRMIAALNVDLSRNRITDIMDRAATYGLGDFYALLDTLPSLLRFDSTPDKEASRQAVLDAIDTYERASAYIRTQDGDAIPGADELLTIAAEKQADEASFRAELAELRQSILSGSIWTTPGDVSVDAQPLFDASGPDPHDMLPEIDALDYLRTGTVGSGLGRDATLGGILPAMTQNDWSIQMCRTFSGVSGFHYERTGCGFAGYTTCSAANRSRLFVGTNYGVEEYTLAADAPVYYNSDSYDQMTVDVYNAYTAQNGNVTAHGISTDGALHPIMSQWSGGPRVFAMDADQGLVAYSSGDWSGGLYNLRVLDSRSYRSFFQSNGNVVPGPSWMYLWGDVIELNGDRMYFLPPTSEQRYQSRISIYDLASGNSNVEAASVTVPFNVTAMKEVRGYLYLSGYGAGLTVVDVRSPSNPVILGSYKWFSGATYSSMKLVGDTLMLAGKPMLTVVDVSTPSTPVFVASAQGDSIVGSTGLVMDAGTAMFHTWNAVQYFDVSLIDSDRDGLDDAWERRHFGDLSQGRKDDADRDGLSNYMEMYLDASPKLADSDNDGMDDGWEYEHMLFVSHPDASWDVDGDGYDNLSEFRGGSDPCSNATIPGPTGASALIPITTLLLGD